jgi:hypothetical protein
MTCSVLDINAPNRLCGLAKQRSIPVDAIRFTRREVREGLSSWSEFQVRTHLAKLLALEYIVPHRGKNGALYVYELLGAGSIDAEKPFMAGLVEPLQPWPL